MTQITAGFKKELLFFWRGYRFFGLVITFIGCAVMYPLMSWMMRIMADTFEQMDGMNELEAMPGMDVIAEMFTIELTYVSSLQMFTSTAIMVALLLFMGAAGGEQKKRSIVLPQTLGLSPAGYVLPKFMFYPPLVFVFTLGSAFLANLIIYPVFGTAYSLENVLLTGSLYGLFMAFLTCLYLFLGISLSQPGLSIIYVLAGSTVATLMLAIVFEIDRFTPWNLISMTDNIVIVGRHTVQTEAMIITAAITLILCLALMGATLFAVIAKRLDNTADEVY
jgi:ABC-2 type transport system permease protein